MSAAVVCVWGSNAWGQCCLSEEEAAKRVEKPRCANRSIARMIHPATPIIQVASGEAHSLFLTAHGDLFTCGRACEGQLGVDPTLLHSKHGRERQLLRVEALQEQRVVSIACGNNHCVAVSDGGLAFEWGLLLPTEDAELADPQATHSRRSGLGKAFREDLNERQRRIVAASWRSYLNDSSEVKEDDSQEAYTTMARAECQRIYVHEPRRCVGLENESAKIVSCGYAHTVLATDSGMLYSAGYGEKGQLGNGSRFPQGRFELVQLPNQRRLRVAQTQDGISTATLACGLNHTAAIASEDGVLFTWGFGVFGQLGLGTEKKESCVPMPVDLPSPAAQVACGANHTLVLTDTGDLFNFGHRDAVGGLSSSTRLPERKLGLFPALSGQQVRHIFAGGTGCFAMLSTEGKDSEALCLQAWGYNQHFQLGRFTAELEQLKPGPVALPPLLGTDIKCFSPGSNHCVAVMGKPTCCLLPPSEGAPYFGHPPLVMAMAGTPSYDIAVKVAQGKGAAPLLGAHRCILRARSQKLADRLVPTSDSAADSSGTAHGRPWVLDLSQYSEVVVEALLEFIYTDFCRLRPAMAVELRPLAQELGLVRLCAGIAAATETQSMDEGKRWVRTEGGRWKQVEVEEFASQDDHTSSYLTELQTLLVEHESVEADSSEYVRLSIRDSTEADAWCEVRVARVLLLTVEFFRGFLEGGFAEASQAQGMKDAAVVLTADNVAAMLLCLQLHATGDLTLLPKVPSELLALIVEAHRLELQDIVKSAEAALAEHLQSNAEVDPDLRQAVLDAAALYGLRKLLPRSDKINC